MINNYFLENWKFFISFNRILTVASKVCTAKCIRWLNPWHEQETVWEMPWQPSDHSITVFSKNRIILFSFLPVTWNISCHNSLGKKKRTQTLRSRLSFCQWYVAILIYAEHKIHVQRLHFFENSVFLSARISVNERI